MFVEIFEFRICLINSFRGFVPRPETFDPVEVRPRTLCIGSKSRARIDCVFNRNYSLSYRFRVIASFFVKSRRF